MVYRETVICRKPNQEGEDTKHALDNLRRTSYPLAIGNGEQLHSRRFYPLAAGDCVDSARFSVVVGQADCGVKRVDPSGQRPGSRSVLTIAQPQERAALGSFLVSCPLESGPALRLP